MMIQRIPVGILAILLMLCFGMACLVLWPIAEQVPATITIDGKAYHGKLPYSAAREAILNKLKMQNVWPDISCNVWGLVLSTAVSIGIARMTLLRGVRQSAVRPVLAGIVSGVFLGALASGTLRIVFMVFGELNLTLPAGLFFGASCPIAVHVFVSRWKRCVLLGRCTTCGYLLTGLPTQVCPECGTQFGEPGEEGGRTKGSG